MNHEVNGLIETLKRAFKSKGLTYQDIARELGLSEPTVKRWFSKKEMTLSQLVSLCELSGLSLSELTALSEKSEDLGHHEYTLEQEKALAKNTSLLALFDHIRNGDSLKSIQKKHKLSDSRFFQLLRQIEKLGLIEIHPNNKIKMAVSKNIKWREIGPLRMKLLPLAKKEFLESEFLNAQELKRFSTQKLTKASIQKFQHQMEELNRELTKTSRVEQKVGGKLIEVGFLTAIRPWEFSALHQIK